MNQGFCLDVVRLIARYLYDWTDLGNFRLASRMCARAIDLTKACPVYYWKPVLDISDYLYLFCWRGRYSYCLHHHECSLCHFTIPQSRIIGETAVGDESPYPWCSIFPYDTYETFYTNSTGEMLTHIERTTRIEYMEEEYLTFVLRCNSPGDDDPANDARIGMHITLYDSLVLELEQFWQWENTTRPITKKIPHKRFKFY